MSDPDLYLYLTRPQWAESWIKGGPVPICPSSKYLSTERRGTQTPDENRHRMVHGIASEAAVGKLERFAAGALFTHCSVEVSPGNFEDVDWLRSEEWGSLILCFSLLKSLSIMRRLEKSAIVRIVDFPALVEAISTQLGSRAAFEHIIYTKSLNRGHDFKDWKDRWQAEARLYWTPKEIVETVVTLPPGIAESVDLTSVPENDPSWIERDDGWFDRHRAAERLVILGLVSEAEFGTFHGKGRADQLAWLWRYRPRRQSGGRRDQDH